MQDLVLRVATWAKQSRAQSTDLNDGDKMWLRSGGYPILAHGAEVIDGHVLITFDPEKNDLKEMHPSGKNTWWIWADHLTILGNLPDNNPKDVPAAKIPVEREVRIAGLGYRGLGAPVDGCQNFTWSELTRNGTRLPENASVSHNIVKVTKAMEEIRGKLGGRAITITSGYRPPAVNRAVGGASQSRHVVGDAVDFAVTGMHPRDVYAALDSWWGSRGGLAWGNGFVHVDCRGGIRARWEYPGAR